MGSITFKTKIQLACVGWRKYCKNTIWVPGHVTLEEVLTIPQYLDTDYEHELYSAHTSEMEIPNTWSGLGEEWWCHECSKERQYELTNEGPRHRKIRKRRAPARK